MVAPEVPGETVPLWWASAALAVPEARQLMALPVAVAAMAATAERVARAAAAQEA
jgi:hypothetical protein